MTGGGHVVLTAALDASDAKDKVSVMSPVPAPASPVSASPTPPSYESARTLHQRARASGLDPDYWYPVALDSQLGPGRVIEAEFSSKSIAVYRGTDGVVRAVANRCGHRKLKL